MVDKLFNIFEYIAFPIFLFTLTLQFGTFLATQFLLFVGGFSLDSLPLLTVLRTLAYVVGGSFIPLFFVYDFGKPYISKMKIFSARVEVLMLRLMASLTALAFVLCALFWFSYPSLSRFEPVTFIQAGIFTLLLAFDQSIMKKYLEQSDNQKPPQKPYIIPYSQHSETFYI
jgi:hypothetical protein